MISPKLNELLKARLLVPMVMWGTFTISVIIIATVAFIVSPEGSGTSSNPELLQMVLPVMAVIFGGLSLLVPRLLLSQERIESVLTGTKDPEALATNPETGSINQKLLEKLKELEEFELGLFRLASLSLVPTVISLALSEAITILGLVLSITAREPEVVLPYATASLLINMVRFPRPKELINRAARLRGRIPIS